MGIKKGGCNWNISNVTQFACGILGYESFFDPNSCNCTFEPIDCLIR